MRKLILAAAVAALSLSAAPAAFAAEAAAKPARQSWSFAGPFGLYDRAQLQRGFKVYREVCGTCHGLKLVAFRTLASPGGPGFTEPQAKSVASEYRITDGPNERGEMFERPGQLSDYILSPDPNEQAARARMNGALPPDLSVIAKARSYEVGFPGFVFDAFKQYQEAGVDYVYALPHRLRESARRRHAAGYAVLEQGISPATAPPCGRRCRRTRSSIPTARRRRSSNIPRTSPRS